MSQEEQEPFKRQTMGLTPTGSTKIKELAKKYNVNMYVVVDVMIKSADEESDNFKHFMDIAVEQHAKHKAVSKEISDAVSQVTAGMTPEQVVDLLEKAKQL
ncbi:MAG: hypothetical protein HRT93_03180 [Piscirickettsiaceae bacterium]|nr:hypothetical protein [Piscirickettsiaceae bacterium]